MKGPSAQKMAKELNIDAKYANEIKRLMRWGPHTAKTYGGDYSDSVDTVMEEANRYMGGFGVESVRDENAWVNSYWQNTIALYVNKGDTYDTTLLYDTDKDRLYITSWGDWYENWQSKHPQRDLNNNMWKPKFHKL